MTEKSVEEIIEQNKFKIKDYKNYPGEISHYAICADGETGMDIQFNNLTGEVTSPENHHGNESLADQDPLNYSTISVKYNALDPNSYYEVTSVKRNAPTQSTFCALKGDIVIAWTLGQLSEERAKTGNPNGIDLAKKYARRLGKGFDNAGFYPLSEGKNPGTDE